MYDLNNPIVDAINRGGLDPAPKFEPSEHYAKDDSFIRTSIEKAIAGEPWIPVESSQRARLKREKSVNAQPMTYRVYCIDQ